MTRSAAVAGVLLGLLVLLESVPAGSLWWVAGVLLLVAAAGTFRRNTPAHLASCALGLVVLGWSLPTYFRTHRMWPFLAIIGLAALTLGLGLLGFLLDRYRVPQDTDTTL